MKRLYGVPISTATVDKILKKNNKQYLKLKRYYRKRQTRYNRPISRDRVQMDVCKIAPGIYQYTAIDDCSGFKVLQLFPRRTATNTLKFLDAVLEQMLLAIQPIQTDRGKEFFAYSVQDRLTEWVLNFGLLNKALHILKER